MKFGVSSRTRSKNVPFFSSFSRGCSSSKRKKSDEDVMSFESGSGSKRKRVKDETFMFPENDDDDVIFIEDDDYDEDGSEHCDVDVKKKGKSYESGHKDGKFVDEKRGWDRENPIIMDLEDDDERDDVRKEVKVDGSGGSGEFVDKNETFVFPENDDDYDEDGSEHCDEKMFEGDESGGSFMIDDKDGNLDDEKCGWEKENPITLDEDDEKFVGFGSEAEDEGGDVEKKVKSDESGRCVIDDEMCGWEKENPITLDGYVESDENDDYDESEENDDDSSSESSFSDDVDDDDEKKKKGSRKYFDVVEELAREVNDEQSGKGEKKKKKIKKKNNKKKNDLSLVKLLAECYSDKQNSMKNDPILLDGDDDDVNPQETRKPPVCVETPFIWSLNKVQKVELTEEEEEERRMNEELKPIWDQMAMYNNGSDAESKIGNLGTNVAIQEKNRSSSSRCDHDIIYDEEIEYYCKSRGNVITESKYKTQLVRDSFPKEGYGKRASSEDSENASFLDCSQSRVKVSDGDLDANFCHKKGTVWDLIPEVKETLYPHQQEGFEVIWKNLAGSINLKKLKNADPDKEGGCIISHAPGTGKTRLTIVFLKAYLKVFPKCFPVIVAPAGLLLTWEAEFKKWNIGVPFHNLNNPELSGKEHDDAVNAFNRSNAQHSDVDTRMVKLISWYKETSILGISYTLYKKLAGTVESENEKMKNQESEKRKEMGNFLRNVPGLLVLDEGHTPRNTRSGIWKVFLEIPTKKRVILSGTPFQNNFLELYNTLSLVKPSFPNMLPHELKKFCQKQERKKASKEWSWEPDYGNSTTENPLDDKIQQLKLLMDPFVHVHKGAILQKKLPGLKHCVLRLKPDGFQKQILESFESYQNTLISENNQTLVSIHPSLFLECTLSEQEKYAVDKDRLVKLRLNHNAGVKTRFLVEFVSLCAAANEKVLVFSQFLRPLHLIIDQLKSALKWTEDEEILYMHGQVKDRQSIIHRFNDSNSQAKILLASTKACSEGISLVGASRVVLLDVEWNPAVEKQAISRAHRIGQKKFVYTYHLLTKGTSECDKYCTQIEKHRLSELIFSAKNADNNDEPKSRATNIEDTILDKMIRQENLKDMFDDCVIEVEGARI